MSELCRFRGIVIVMYTREHGPPHFHARSAGGSAVIDIASMQVTRGRLPHAARRYVLSWARRRRPELQNAWDRAERGQDPGKIAPPE